MAGQDATNDIDLRRGFRRAGSTLFWLSATLVLALWAAQKAGLLSLGVWMTPVAFLVLLTGFIASSVARLVGLALHAVTRSSLATAGASQVSQKVAQLSWLPRLVLGFLPGASLLTIADLLASIRDGSFADGMRGAFQMTGAVLGGGVMGIGAAAAGWHWWHGASLSSLQGWLVVAFIGAGLMVLFMLAAGWVAQAFRPQSGGQAPPPRITR